jgi:hypothetical protein
VSLLERLKTEAVNRNFIDSSEELDAAKVFRLVRDMPYRRATDRRPETTISEWQGTCSGKHYLLKELFAELGLPSKVIACITVTPIDPTQVPDSHKALYEAAGRHFVDVHNYLIVEVPDDGTMIVDATFPLSTAGAGMTVNEDFVLGQDQQIAADVLDAWPIPDGRDPQAFKDELLHKHFTPAELEFREEVIRALGEMS